MKRAKSEAQGAERAAAEHDLGQAEIPKLLADLQTEVFLEALQKVVGRFAPGGRPVGIPRGMSRYFRSANGMDDIEVLTESQICDLAQAGAG